MHHILRAYLRSRDVSDGYAAQLKSAVTRFNGTAINADALNDHLRQFDDRPATKANHRRMLLTLARFGMAHDMCQPFSLDRVMRVRVPRGTNGSYTVEQVRQMVDACENPDQCQPRDALWLSSPFLKLDMPRRLWLASLVRAKWDTALRWRDLLSLSRAQVETGTTQITQNKTGRVFIVRLRESTLEAIDRTFPPDGPERDLCWPEWGKMSNVHRAVSRLRDIAGLPRHRNGLRKGSGTNVETQLPGAGHKQTGNDPRTFERFYCGPHAPTHPQPEEL